MIEKNFHGFRQGKTFERIEAKPGKEAAELQMTAAVLSKAGVKRKVEKEAQKIG